MILEAAVDRSFSLETLMRVDVPGRDVIHRLGEYATRPIELPWGALGSLLLLAGTSLRRRRAFPAHPMTAHSSGSNCGF